MKTIIDLVIPRKTNKKKLIKESDHILEKISKYGLDSVLEDKKDKKKPQ